MKKNLSAILFAMSLLLFSACSPESGFEEITDVGISLSPQKESYALSEEVHIQVSIPLHFGTYDSYSVDFTTEVHDVKNGIFVPSSGLSAKDSPTDSQASAVNRTVVISSGDYAGKKSADFDFYASAAALGDYRFLVDIVAAPESGYVYGVCHKIISISFRE